MRRLLKFIKQFINLLPTAGQEISSSPSVRKGSSQTSISERNDVDIHAVKGISIDAGAKQVTTAKPISDAGFTLWSQPLVEVFAHLGIDPEKAARACTTVAKKKYKDDPAATVVLSSLAAELSPKPFVEKWYGFTLSKAGFPVAATAVLSPLKGKLTFSPSEQRELARLEKHMQGKAEGVGGEDFFSTVAFKLERTGELNDIHFLLYASIDLNTIDGSSVWLSSMASILAKSGRGILISKRNITEDVVVGNIQNRENLIIIEPADLGLGDGPIEEEMAEKLIAELDNQIPGLQRIVVRGLNIASLLHKTRRYKGRSWVYLTDFYTTNGESNTSTDLQVSAAKASVLHAALVLCQTNVIDTALRQITGVAFKSFLLPPPIPDESIEAIRPIEGSSSSAIHIGYSGKIEPRWGVLELLEWTKQLQLEGVEVSLHIAFNKIGDGAGLNNRPGFSKRVRDMFEEVGAEVHAGLPRREAMQLMASMDFVWCFRPGMFENRTYELSTKLVEMVANGGRCICYPSRINVETLSKNYPFFVRDLSDLRKLLTSPGLSDVPTDVRHRIKSEHSIGHISGRLADAGHITPIREQTPEVTFASHDFKFIEAFISHLKCLGFPVYREQWEWGGPAQPMAGGYPSSQAKIIFCEWGLANAVWHSQNKRPGTRLIVRVHAQETRKAAVRFGKLIIQENVDIFIFVSEKIRQEAIELFGWPEEKAVVIPNFVLDDEYDLRSRTFEDRLTLGLAGMVPQSKRPDRALHTLKGLIDRGLDVRLSIKGHRPEDLEFMHAPNRVGELDYYRELYNEIERDPRVRERVDFQPWGNDMALWYEGVDVILSPSDSESFHYSVSDGVLSGCFPVIWPWEGAENVYPKDWIVEDTNSAIQSILAHFELNAKIRRQQMISRRSHISNKYGKNKVYDLMKRQIFLNDK